MPKQINLAWTKNIANEKGRTEFESLLRGSRFLMGRLQDLIKERMEEIARQERSIDQYSNASWPYLQAHRNGGVAELRKILDLLSFLED